MKSYTGNQARERLNSAKMLVPLIDATLAMNDESQQEFVVELVTALRDMSRSVTGKLLLPEEQKPWIEAVTAAQLAPVLAIAIRSCKSVDECRANVEKLFLSVVEVIPPTPQTVFENLPRTTDAELLHARTMAKFLPLCMKINALSPSAQHLFYNKGGQVEFLHSLRRALVERADRIAWQLEPYQEKERFISYKSALNTLSDVALGAAEEAYASMRRYFTAIKDNGAKQQEYRATLGKHPTYCPLCNKTLKTLDSHLETLFPQGQAKADKADDGPAAANF